MIRFSQRNLSFVRREGRLTSGQQQALDHHWLRYGLHSEQGCLDPVATFGRTAPCILEIGFGSGESLIEQAKTYPHLNFIGIEVYRPGIGALLAKVANESIENIRLYCEDAVDILQNAIADNSLSALQIFFPDPWPKRRHHKRRLIQPALVSLARTKCCAGALLHIATDWQHYADHIKQVMAKRHDFTPFTDSTATAIAPLQRPLTKFERRGQRLGHTIHDLRYIAC